MKTTCWVGLCFLFPSMALGLTSDELRLLAGEAEEQRRIRAHQVNTSDLMSLLPLGEAKDKPVIALPHEKGSEEKSAPSENDKLTPVKADLSETTHADTDEKKLSPAKINQKPQDRSPASKNASPHTPSPPKVTKHDEEPSKEKVVVMKTARVSQGEKGAEKNAHVYVPPPRLGATAQALASDAVKVDNVRYGIQKGTWLPARLSRTATSSDPGSVELVLSEQITGERRILPAGTLFFAQKTYNADTRRLDLWVGSALPPDGEELAVQGWVYDQYQVAGIEGQVVKRAVRQSVDSGVKQGLMEVGRSALQSLASQHVVGKVVQSAGEQVLDDQRADAGKAPHMIIVTPQPVRIRLEQAL